MKKKHLLLWIILLAFLTGQAQVFTIVTGTVTDEATGAPVPGQEVLIDADSLYSTSVFTNESGSYIDTIVTNTFVEMLYIATMDLCTYLVHDTLVLNPPQGAAVVADFEICTEIVGGDCQADFYYMPDSLNPSVVQFIDQSTPAGQIVSWYWEFGEDTSTEQNPTYTFGEPGTYPVCLTIMAFDGLDSCISIHCEDVVIGTAPECQAGFYYAADSTNPAEVFFFDVSTPANLITSWSWDFGDGSSSDEQNPVHTFGAPGIYIVCLTIEAQTGDEPCTSTFCLEVFVQGGATYSLGGNTFAGIYQLDQGFAYAYKVENGNYTEIYSQIVDTLGYYFFNPFAGEYYVKVEPTPNSAYFNDYLPTYYGDAIHWEDAQLISLNQNIFTADIHLVAMSAAATGDGSISGHIFHGDDKGGDPAFDVQVMLANASGDYVGMNFTNEEGYFEFAGLGNGTYTLYAEVVGKSITPKTFQITDDNLHVTNIMMTIGTSSITFGVDELNSRFVESISDPYPNPVSGLVNMDVEVTEPTVLEVRILNLTGQVLERRRVDLDRSERVQVNTASLRPGFYLLEVKTADNVRKGMRFIKY